MANDWLVPSSHLRRQREQQEARKLSWGFHDGIFYSMILAADYTAVQGEVAVQESSSEGLPYVAYLDAGDVLSYRATLESAGTYRMEIRVASPGGEGSLTLRNSLNFTQTYASIDTFPASGDWNTWETLETTIDFLETDINLDLVVQEAGWNLLWLSLEKVEITNSPTAKPAEITSPVTAPTNEQSPAVSPETSDTCIVSLSASEYTDSDEAARVSSQDNSLELEANSWATYTVQVPADGTYLWRMKVTLSSATGALNLTNAETEEIYASVKEPKIDSWRNINIVLILEAGVHIMKINNVEGSWRLSSVCLDPINSFNVDYIGSGNDTITTTPASPVSPAPTMAPVVPPATNSSQAEAPTVLESSEPVATTQTATTTAAPTASPTQAVNSSQTAAPTSMTVSESSVLVSPTLATNDSETAAPTTSLANMTDASEFAVLLSADTMSTYGAVLGTNNENVSSVTQLDTYDWVRYPMSTLVGGNYTMEIRVSSESGEGAFDLIDYSTGSNYSSIDSIPATGVDVWETINSTVTLPEGDVYFMIRVREGGWMYSWIRFSEVSG